MLLILLGCFDVYSFSEVGNKVLDASYVWGLPLVIKLIIYFSAVLPPALHTAIMVLHFSNIFKYN